jgi:Ca2+-binding EF-hand superfamily protein
MNTITVPLVLAGFCLPAVGLAAPEVRQAGPEPGAEGARRGLQQFVEAWKKADTNGDGLISSGEFAAMKRIAMLPEEKRTGLFTRLDKDGDGSLSRDELGQLVKPQDGKHQMMPRLRELDTDKNGSISMDEFRAGEFFKKLPPERQEALFRRLDENRDGVISPKDRPVEEGPGPPAPSRDPRHLLHILDKNADEALTLDEFRQAPFVRGLDENEQKARFEKMDRNRDLKLDATEFSHAEHKGEPRPDVPPAGPPPDGPPPPSDGAK